jgi:hypothetical protein
MRGLRLVAGRSINLQRLSKRPPRRRGRRGRGEPNPRDSAHPPPPNMVWSWRGLRDLGTEKARSNHCAGSAAATGRLRGARSDPDKAPRAADKARSPAFDHFRCISTKLRSQPQMRASVQIFDNLKCDTHVPAPGGSLPRIDVRGLGHSLQLPRDRVEEPTARGRGPLSASSPIFPATDLRAEAAAGIFTENDRIDRRMPPNLRQISGVKLSFKEGPTSSPRPDRATSNDWPFGSPLPRRRRPERLVAKRVYWPTPHIKNAAHSVFVKILHGSPPSDPIQSS